jgi:hypothetical protein
MYSSGQGGDIPFWRMASLPYDDLERRHAAVLASSGATGAVVAAESVPGAGSVPGETIPSPAIRLDVAPDPGWKHLVAADPPVVARRREGGLYVDLRTVDQRDDELVAATMSTLP